MADTLANPVKEVNTTTTPVIEVNPAEKKATTSVGDLLKQDNNSDETTKSSDTTDRSETIENNSSGSATTKTNNQIAAEITRKIFKEDFSSEAYTKDYYGEPDLTKAEEVFQAIKESEIIKTENDKKFLLII